MEKINLGKSAFEVSSIGLGCWQFSGSNGLVGSFWGDMPQSRVDEIVQNSLDSGVNWFDTAEIYGDGVSEKALSASLQRLNVKPGSVFIATKWNPVLRFSTSIGQTFPVREKNLSPYAINLHQVHNPASISSIPNQMKAFLSLLKDGKIDLVGVSNYSQKQMQSAHQALQEGGAYLASNQMRYHLLDRSIEFNGVMDYARREGITIIAYSPLAQGLLTGRYHEDSGLIQKRPGFRRYLPSFRERSLRKTLPLIEALRAIGDAHKVTPAQIALRWVVQYHQGTVVAIPGASSALQARQNAEVMDFRLTEAEMQHLDQISREIKPIN